MPLLVAALVLLGALVSVDAGSAAGGEEPEPTTTTVTTLDTTSTTSTTIDGSTTTTTSVPGETTTTTTTIAGSASTTTTTKPRPGGPTITTTSTTIPTLTELPEEEMDLLHHLLDLDGEDFREQVPFDPNMNRVVTEAVEAARADVLSAEARYEAVTAQQALLEVRLVELEAQVELLGGEQQEQLAEAQTARELFEERAVEAYIRGSDPGVAALFGAETVGELAARSTMVAAVLEADETVAEEYVDRRAGLGAELTDLHQELADTRRRLATADREEQALRTAVARARVEQAVWQAGSQVEVPGFVFPVFGPNTFGDSYGASRMAGTSYAHWHEGTDINAATGTPLVAVEGGTISDLTSESLGGRGLFLRGDSGVRYFYAHLSAYAAGLHAGQRVEPGEVIGYVGTTGNAVGAHLHFEIEVEGRAVNPYPMLRVAWDWQAPFILEAASQLVLPTGLDLPDDGGIDATAPTLDGPGATLPPLAPGETTTTVSVTTTTAVVTAPTTRRPSPAEGP